MNINPTSKQEQERQRKMRRDSAQLREQSRRDTRCLQCGARPGEYCTAKNGARRMKLHAIRYSAIKTGKAAEAVIGPIKSPTAINPAMTYALVADADVREIETINIKKQPRAFNPSA